VAINYFAGWSQSDLETALEAAQADLASGKSTIGAGSGLVSIRSQVELTPQRRIELILKALNAINPSQYPITSVTITDVLRVGFSQTTPSCP
jgi:hypothetical protein